MMSHEVDVSFLDTPEVRGLIFYPRRDSAVPETGAVHFIEVGQDVRIGCRFYPASKDCPSLLYFHGNGETAGDYEEVAPLFNRLGINLCVADYRGYGLSGGSPTVTTLLEDAHPVFRGFQKIVEQDYGGGRCFLMGRSLGSVPAVELACHYQDEISGLIVESGGADLLARLLYLSGIEVTDAPLRRLKEVSNRVKIRRVQTPTLVIHAEHDMLIPLEEGRALYEASAAADKQLFIVPGADHNDLWQVGGERYYGRIGEFIREHCSPPGRGAE
jgi:alpha-beta hydrolase superfamily lysophospholipase